jgi:RHS repeat-associated protein
MPSRDKNTIDNTTVEANGSANPPLTGQDSMTGQGPFADQGPLIPSLQLPTGGGAIRGIDEKFQVNAASGTSSCSIPIPFSPSRMGFSPPVSLQYNSGNGNSSFGLGWQLRSPSIVRRTRNYLPQYEDANESDIFQLSGTEDLVPVLTEKNGEWVRSVIKRAVGGVNYSIAYYIPRIESSFSSIERWTDEATGQTHWRVLSADNMCSYFGLTAGSRVSDPGDPGRVFEWLLCQAQDDKGNIALLNYKTEDGAGIPSLLSEKNHAGMCTQVYLSSVWYGNARSWYAGDPIPGEDQFIFRTIFDYGEHDASLPVPANIYNAIQPWACRKDPFSSYRSGFDIRTYRRCSRVLMFHCLPGQELPVNPCLVRSLSIHYDDDLALLGNGDMVGGFSFLVRATQNGHIWDAGSNSYTTKSLPDMDFQYQQHEWNTTVQDVSPVNLQGAPTGVDNAGYQWTDLFSEGIMGILTEQAGAWYYKYNLGGGAFTPAMPVASLPSFRGLSTGALSIRELEGDGVKYLVQDKEGPRGFFKLCPENDWQKMRLFDEYPVIDPRDRNARYVDLNEDGREEILYTEEYQFRWYESLGEQGFRIAGTVPKPFEEEKGPAMVFADRDQSIFLADMSGDGLADIVRIRNGEICYWPNLGWGRFGPRVGMDNAPVFDTSDGFNPSFLRLADVDGSGTTDLVYLGRNDFRVWMNLNGNAWTSAPEILAPFPRTDSGTVIDVLDFLGTGTASIVCSSPFTKQPLRYIDLMGSKKPCVLNGYKNNCGKEVELEYTSSTHFYLADKQAGIPWITKLPFPVQCIASVTIRDLVRETVFKSVYSYRHGFFDPYDKEFRGFARVEQEDTESFEQFVLNNAKNVVEQDLYQPPVRTISWFHTGVFLRDRDFLSLLGQEYFRNGTFAEYAMPAPLLPAGMDPDDIHEAFRACKGLPLRSEVYSDDGSPLEALPYSTAQSNAQVTLVQPRGPNRYACFLVTPSESISYSYERATGDPRISHSFVLDTDQYGNILKGASVVYPRAGRPTGTDAIPDTVWNEQDQLHISTKETDFTQDIIQPDLYRLRVACETRAYEIGGLLQPGTFYFSLGLLSSSITGAPSIPYEQDFTGGLQQRLYRQSRVYFAKDDLSGSLPLRQLSNLGITYRNEQLAFTQGLVNKYYGSKVTNAMLATAMYTHSEGDADWWIQSGTLIFSATPAKDFYIPSAKLDPFGNATLVTYDPYFLLTETVTDAISNMTSVVNDYRTLSPTLSTDPNLNRSAVQTDELGMTIAIAVMGKQGAGEGDTLADPTVKMGYDYLNWQLNGQPNFVHVQARETHGDPNTAWLESFVYSDGGGAVIMTKTPAAPGPAAKWNPVTKTVDQVNADPRWVGNGRTILNNKGNPVKKYEPYFSASSGYETESALVETGVTAILYYDPLGRNIRTDLPNGTFSRLEFDNWMSREYDANDTVKDSAWYAALGSPDPTGPEPSDPDQRAAWLAAAAYDTPVVHHADSLGRTFYSIADYGGGVTAATYTLSDFTVRYTSAFDQLGRNVSRAYTSLRGQAIYSVTAERGERWVFTDVIGRLVHIWDNDLAVYSNTYDKLYRPLSSTVTQGGGSTIYSHHVYGDLLPAATAQSLNLKGRLYQVYDPAGVATIEAIDFKGNILRNSRTLCKDYKHQADWTVLDGLTDIGAIQAAAAPLLETESFPSTLGVDALNRPLQIGLPDGTVLNPSYDAGGVMATLSGNIQGAAATLFLAGQSYNARGQRLNTRYGNGTSVNYGYDPQTFRLVNLTTLQHPADPASQSLQDLNYTFDPVGNITQVRDDAQQTRYFKNAVVYPENKFRYDALYQILSATGREHAGAGMDAQRGSPDIPALSPIPEANDANAVRNYTENYSYDLCGNILSLQHVATGASWTQRYQYQYQVNPADTTNRLAAISQPGDGPGIFSGAFSYAGGPDNGLHGNMMSMPGQAAGSLQYNVFDQLSSVNLGGGGTAWYVYAAGGGRMRKVIERQGGLIQERIYLGLIEIYRERTGPSAPDLERYTLHISDNACRFAQVDIKTIDTGGSDPANPLGVPVIRYQYPNHLGSALLETDVNGQILSFEEYHPFGTSSYRVSQAGDDISLKRYRYNGKERDEETGLYYYGARYYAAWLGRWTSSDPAGFADGFNVWRYCRNNPICLRDPQGLDSEVTTELPDDLKPDLKNHTEASRQRLQQYVDTTVFTDEAGNAYRYHGNIEWRDDEWWLNTTTVEQVDPATADEKSSGQGGGGKGDSKGSTKDKDAGGKDAGKGAAGGAGDKGAGDAGKGDAGKGDGDKGAGSGGKQNNPGGGGAAASEAGPAAETFIWDYPFKGIEGGYRGNIMEWFYGVPWRSNTKDWDVETDTTVKQLKSTQDYDNIGQITRDATRDASRAIGDNPTGTMTGKNPQAVIINRTDAPASAEGDVGGALARVRKPIPGTPEAPEYIRGIPGKGGVALRGLGVAGTGLSAYSLYRDFREGDVPMGIGDGLATAGGGLEIYAMTTAGATVGGVSAVAAGGVLAGAGIAVTSGVSAYREFKSGDYLGGAVDSVGVLAGLAIMAGIIFAAPEILIAGAIVAAAVGLFHLVRWLAD